MRPERGWLGLALPLAGAFAGFFAAAGATSADLSEMAVRVAGVVGVLLGIVGAARLAPHVFPTAVLFSLGRRALAGLAGVVAVAAIGRCLSYLGLDPNLSETTTAWGAVQEGLWIALTFGGMVAAAGIALGPAAGEDKPGGVEAGRRTRG